jgi:hypothetical protein
MMNTPTSGRRKQRYLLDIDDVIRRGFMTEENSRAFLEGINQSGTDAHLAVPYGGTNNHVFADQELLRYDAPTRRIVSAGITGVLSGASSVFLPSVTGTIYNKDGVNLMNSSSVSMTIAEQLFFLPANHRWTEFMMVFQFRLTDSNPQVTGLEVLLGGGGIQPSHILSPSAATVYQVQGAPDSSTITWMAMGRVPPEHELNSQLAVRLIGAPQDVPSERSVITRIGYTGALAIPPAGGQKGVPIFLDPVVTLLNSPASDLAWHTIDISAHVPQGASAVILQTFLRQHVHPVGVQIRHRAHNTGHATVLANVTTTDSVNTQNILPFQDVGGFRSLQLEQQGQLGVDGASLVQLVGYIS